MVYEDAGQAVSDSLVKQHSGNGGIHSAAQSENDLVVAQLRPELVDRSLHERRRSPLAAASADAYDEVAQQLSALNGVEHFGMELHAP